eukprot:TRINITY_DN8008_c0_g1_i2.p1 TRINITY_DN8008_c0_g1~~TRINITY_DN8008_c0_g1_i2.p1  ORF type:complete len:183 (+),score=26.40 TRINITY_DN8008_c0_g1_i2:77-625(+)
MVGPKGNYRELEDGASEQQSRRTSALAAIRCVSVTALSLAAVIVLLVVRINGHNEASSSLRVTGASQLEPVNGNDTSSLVPVVDPMVFCRKDTSGTCAFFNCDSSRGPTNCINSKCYCEDGFCSNAGVCKRPNDCVGNTGGSCYFLGCKSARGPTDCVSHSCVCRPGYCAYNGVCYRGSDFR